MTCGKKYQPSKQKVKYWAYRDDNSRFLVGFKSEKEATTWARKTKTLMQKQKTATTKKTKRRVRSNPFGLPMLRF